MANHREPGRRTRVVACARLSRPGWRGVVRGRYVRALVFDQSPWRNIQAFGYILVQNPIADSILGRRRARSLRCSRVLLPDEQGVGGQEHDSAKGRSFRATSKQQIGAIDHQTSFGQRTPQELAEEDLVE